MPRYACPICGDPNGYLFWVDPEPPEGCPQDDTGTVKSVTECKYQMGKAWQAAEFRKLVPDAFDDMGKMLPGRLGEVLNAFGAKHPNKALVI